MAGKVQAHKNAVLELIRGTAWTTQANLYIAILKTNPSDDNMTGVAETNYTNYTRQSATIGTFWEAVSDETAGSVRRVRNAGVLNFPTAGGTGDTVNGWAVCKGSGALSTDGQYWSALTGAPKTINANDPVSAAAAALKVTEQ